MKVRMIKSENGSIDGRFVQLFCKGKEYETPQEISESLCKVFVGMGVAEEVTDKPETKEPAENKVKPSFTNKLKKAATKKAAKSKPKAKKD